MNQIMFVTLSAQNEIASYSIDSGGGVITEIGRIPVTGRPAPLTVDVENSVLYVGRRDIPLVSSFKYDHLGVDIINHFQMIIYIINISFDFNIHLMLH